MARKRLSVEQIIQKLREAELELTRGQTVPQACKKPGVTEQTYYRWCDDNSVGPARLRQCRQLPTRVSAAVAKCS